ncbi:large conductance mechanosensitive channel protein MscL [Candidatus Gracilibacteria bacterium]|nr:large conductance mechanosensitive channel protein MscL [Candidatus Gracilibacteria bacterium]
MLQDFKKFLIGGNVMDMAVGFIFGAAFGTVVKSLVSNVVMPPVGQLMAGVDFANMFYALDGKEYASLKALDEAGAPAIKYGAFINDIIGFVILGFVIFMLVRMAMKMKNKEEEKPAETPADIKLLEEIRDSLKKKK